MNSKSLTDLLCQLEKEDIPVLVCITHGDHLCADICKELNPGSGNEELPTLEKIKHRLELELKVNIDLVAISLLLVDYSYLCQ